MIATRDGGIPEIIVHGENGFLVDVDDLEGLTACTRRLIGDRELREAMGRKARARVEAEFTTRPVRRLEQLIEGSSQLELTAVGLAGEDRAPLRFGIEAAKRFLGIGRQIAGLRRLPERARGLPRFEESLHCLEPAPHNLGVLLRHRRAVSRGRKACALRAKRYGRVLVHRGFNR